VPYKRLADRVRQGPPTMEDLNTLQVFGELRFVETCGSIEAAHERYRYLWDSGQLPTDRFHPEAFWYFDGPDHLRSFEAWFETTDFDAATTVEEQITLHEAFDRAREKWLKDNK
jgi:hypothetical protein